jgi:PIN domain nuclease of toxin-antitoxin system
MIVLDTCAVIWDALEPSKLSDKAIEVINKAELSNQLFISDITIWEIAMLVKKGRIKMNTSSSELISCYLQTRSIQIIAISPDIAEFSVNLSDDINKDPADRIIAATSILNNAQLVTADQNLIESDLINTIW